MAYAASGDTWGISGPAFLTFFLLSAGGLLVLGTIHRATVFGGSRDAATRPLGAQQAAYLHGGSRLALYASLAALRATGAIGSDPADRTLVQTGPMPAGSTPLDTAVYNAAARKPKTRDLGQDSWVKNALEQLRAGIESSGLALSSTQRGNVRVWGFAALLLLAVAVFRLIAGLANDKPVGFLLLAMVPVAIMAFVQLLRVPNATRAGRSALRRTRAGQAHLAPAMSPSYATYGRNDAAMGVALYGTASLWAMDPAFATEAEIQRAAAGSGYDGSSFSSGGDSGGSSSSCGGGGSSCGGGGGCGGGGCGG